MEFTNPSATDVVASIERNGCALIRGAIPETRVARYLDALNSIYIKNESNGDVAMSDFALATGITMQDLFSFSVLSETANLSLGRHHPDISTFMSVAASAANSIKGIGLHTDGIIQGTKDTVLSIWAPLHECGSDAPGIAIVPASKRAVIYYLREKFPTRRIPGWRSETEWTATGAFDEASIFWRFGRPWLPIMFPGDVMIFTNWTIHGSHITPQMTKRRSAAIYRLKKRTVAQNLWNDHLQFVWGARSLKALVKRHIA